MRKVADEAQNMLSVLRDTESELAALGTQKPTGWDQMQYGDKVKYLDQMRTGLQDTNQIVDKLQDSNDQEAKIIKDLGNMGVQTPTLPVTSSRRFNLSRFSQMGPTADMAAPVVPSANPMGVSQPQVPDQTQAQPQQQTPRNTSEVRQLLDGFVSTDGNNGKDQSDAIAGAIDKAYQYITTKFTNPNQSTADPLQGDVQGNSDQTVRDAVNSYYSSADESEKDSAASILARTIFPQNSTQDGQVDDGEVPAVQQEGVKVNVANLVEKTNQIIKKLAESDAKKAKVSSFNLSKTAHVKNVTIFDPDKTISDEFSGIGGVMSENDLLERNKGYGIMLTDHATLNWEKVWRETVMDKYDPLYLERRFEVDKNVPEINNAQLKPGEIRRITPPEYGNLEARLEANRTEMNKERGYSPSQPGTPFNWKKASKTAQVQPPLANVPSASEIMGQPSAGQSTVNWKCSVCGDTAKNGSRPIKCEKCGAENAHYAVPAPTAAPTAKTKGTPGGSGVPIMADADKEVEKLASVQDGVFWDSGEKKFVVVAGKKKQKFDSYYDAEKFQILAQSNASPIAPVQQKPVAPVQTAPQQPVKSPTTKTVVPAPSKKPRLTPQQIAKMKQVSNHAHGLGIDG